MLSGYKLIRLLGKGTYGKVWQVEKDNKLYALKEFFNTENLNISILSEIYISLENKHPNLIKGEEFFLDAEDNIYLILELADVDLHNYVNNNNIPLKTALRLFYELLSAINFLHESNFTHCDIKPHNCLIKDDMLKLADFGVSRFRESGHTLCSPVSYGTPQSIYKYFGKDQYFPPEIMYVLSQEVTEKHNDIWSAGIVFTFILTGISNIFYYGNENNPMGNYLAYLSDPVSYLYRFNIPGEFIPLLIFIFKPDVEQRATSVNQILQEWPFRISSYSKPIEGFNLWKPLKIREKKYDTTPGVEKIVYTIKGLSLNVYVLHASITLYYYLLFKTASFPYAVVSLMTKLYQPEKEMEINKYTILTIGLYRTHAAELKILKAMDGILYFPTFATLAFSQQVLDKTLSLLLNYKAYVHTDIIIYMKELESLETVQERENRIPVNNKKPSY